MTDECKKGLVDPEAGYGDDSEDSPSDAGYKKIKSLESRVSNTSPKSSVGPCYRQQQHQQSQHQSQHPHQQQSQTLRNVSATTATATTTASSITTLPPVTSALASSTTVNVSAASASASEGGVLVGGSEVRKKVSPQGSTSCVLESSQSSSCRMRHKYIQRKSAGGGGEGVPIGSGSGSKSVGEKMAAAGILRGVLSKQSSTTDSAKLKGGSTTYSTSGGGHHQGTGHPNASTSTWKPLSLPEKKYLIAVERGDLATVRRFVENPSNFPDFNPNCTDPIGRSALLMAIDNENLEMIELLISYGVEMRDALLHAINEEFVEAVELLLDHEEAIHVPGKPWSWEQVEFESFTSDVTPLILAAHKNNYEIIKLILDRGISPIPSPHDARCGCKSCRQSRVDDHLRHSRSRINAYRALASPSLIALSSKDPILTAFELSWQLRRLSFLEPEFKTDYLELRKQCQQFATALLDHTRTTHELEVLLNYDPGMDSLDSHGKMTLSRLKLAIRCKQKKFCAHANVQQLLASIWYEGLPGFRRKNIVVQTLQIIFIGFLFPFLSLAYIIAPCTQIGQVMKKPFIKFICHSASYMTFLVLLALASQRIESDIFDFDISLNSEAATKRGAPPTLIELMVLPWVLGLIWSEIKQLWELGLADYLSDMWNILDFITNSLYVATITLRVIAYLQVQKEISQNTGTAHLSRESWDAFDPILLAEGLFAAANIFSSLKLVYIFSVNPHLGPLQISLGRMVIDILKFFSVYTLVCFAFACGMNQLLWYYADMEKQVCIVQSKTLANGSWAYSYANPTAHLNVSGPIISDRGRRMFMPKSANEACIAYRKFSNLFESLQTLFWATFGLIDLENFELTGIQSYTRFWGMTMFGCYCIINVTVLLNLLIAMMNHSYQIISEQADTEWKFARTKLWMSYFEDGGTVPIPFNIIPTPKSFVYLFKWFVKKFFSRTKFAKNEAIKTIRRKARQASERDHRYQSVCRSLVRRYITNEQRQSERQRGVTEDDCNEIKQDISALRFELIELLQRGKAPNLFNATNAVPSTVNAATAAAMAAANGYSVGGANFNPFNTIGHPGMVPTCHNNGTVGPGGPVLTTARTFDLGSLVNVVGKRGRKRERRLMKGFDFNFLFMDTTTSIDEPELSRLESKSSIKSNVKSPSSTRNKFVRLAKGIAGKRGSRANKWKQLIEATKNKVAKGNGESSQPPAATTQTPTQGASDSNAVAHSSIPDSMADENWKTIDREDDDCKGGGSGSGHHHSHHHHQHQHHHQQQQQQQHNTARRHSRLSEFDLNTRRNLFARKVTTLIASGSSGVISGDRGTPVANDSLQSDPDTQGGCSISLLPSAMGDTGDCSSSAMAPGFGSRSLRKSTSSVSSGASYQSSYLPLRGEYSSDLSHRQLFHPSSTSTSTTASANTTAAAALASASGSFSGSGHHQHHHLHSQPLPPPPYPSPTRATMAGGGGGGSGGCGTGFTGGCASAGTIVAPSPVVPLSLAPTMPPKLTVTLPANESSGNGSMGGESALEAPIESPVSGRSSKSPKKKRRNHSRSVTRSSRSRSRSPSKSPSKSPSPQSLNASVLIGLTQVRRSRNEWI